MCGLLPCGTFAPARAEEPPVIPVGLDAYRQWERWPVQRIGGRAYMRSTYDRRGGNEAADASHFLYQRADDDNVTLDLEGPGVLYFARYNHWHGSPWRYVVDGAEHIVQETSSKAPTRPVEGSVFEPKELFPPGLTYTWSTTKGADLMWNPLGFSRSFRMGYSRTCYGTGYYIFHRYAGGAKLSRPIEPWDGKMPPDAADVLALLARSGTDIAPQGVAPVSRRVSFSAGHKAEYVQLTSAPAAVRAILISAPRAEALDLAKLRLTATWDDRPHPSIDAPVPLFFGTGTLYNRDGREHLVKAFPVNVRYDADRVHLACYFPMPFFRSAKIGLVATEPLDIPDVDLTVRWAPISDPPNHLGYFHATYRDCGPNPPRGGDLVLLDTRQAEGGGDWSGSFVGTSFVFTKTDNLTTLEGDPRFYFDDSMSPQAQGTGTEEWGGGGDYWGGLNMTLPLAGHPLGAKTAKDAKDDLDKIHSAYRFLLADLFPFGKNARITLEHGGTNESREHYETVTYWYGLPAASVVKTDELKIGDAASERAHGYASPAASAPYAVTSRYEWGADTLRPPGIDRPRAEPETFAEFEFEARAGAKYHIWMRGKNVDGDNLSDASWLQFDEAIGTRDLGPTYAHPKAFGNWLDRFSAGTFAWSSALPQEPPQTVTFARDGKHRLRVQPRHPGHVIDQIWLSTTQASLPAKDAKPPATDDLSEIVLDAAKASAQRGDVKPIDDPGSVNGRALSVGGAGELVTYPPHTDTGRKTTGTSEFTLRIDPANLGVMLRRKLDYALPNQRAEVDVADASGGRTVAESDWRPAGIWYLAGSNTCVFSRPPGELDPPLHIVQTSNRRFRDDEFLIARDLTAGRSAIAVRVKFTPVDRPLFPGHPFPEKPAWSEIRYDAYCFVMPKFTP